MKIFICFIGDHSDVKFVLKGLNYFDVSVFEFQKFAPVYCLSIC